MHGGHDKQEKQYTGTISRTWLHCSEVLTDTPVHITVNTQTGKHWHYIKNMAPLLSGPDRYTCIHHGEHTNRETLALYQEHGSTAQRS